jgi:putative membrane protein
MNTTLLLPGLMAFAHHIAAFALVAALVFEWATFSATPTLKEAQRLQFADMLYGLSAAVVVTLGFLRAIYFEKGWAFYSHNLFFWIKLGAFIVIALLSIYPTIRFLQWNAFTQKEEAPVVSAEEALLIRRLLWAEVVLLVLMLLAAPLMSRAVWMSSQ